MTFKIITATAVAASILAMSTVAEAGGKRHGGGYNKHGHHGKPYRPHRNWHGHGGYYIEPGYNCKYLFRKARRTGSNYWWNQYRSCVSYH